MEGLLPLGIRRGAVTASVTVARSAPASHLHAENRLDAFDTLADMTKPASVTGCMSCGALYSPTGGDEGLCGPCSSVVAAEPPLQAQETQAPAPAGQPSSADPRGPEEVSALRTDFRRRGFGLRRIVGAAVGASLAFGSAAWVMPQRSRSEAWSALRRGSFSDAWTSIRRHGLPGAWARMEHYASDAWATVRSHTPFAASPATAVPPVTPAAHRRSQPAKVASKR